MNTYLNGFLVTASCLLLLTVGCSSGDSALDFPSGCVSEGYEYRNNNLIINQSSSNLNLYLIHNVSEENFWLNHAMTDDPGASAGWGSEINTGNWSAIAMNKENFEMNCTILGAGEVKDLDCEKLVKVCKIQKPVFNSQDSGSYWVSENKPLNDLLESIKNGGISW